MSHIAIDTDVRSGTGKEDGNVPTEEDNDSDDDDFYIVVILVGSSLPPVVPASSRCSVQLKVYSFTLNDTKGYIYVFKTKERLH